MQVQLELIIEIPPISKYMKHIVVDNNTSFVNMC